MMLPRGATPEISAVLPRKVAVRLLPAAVEAVCEPWPFSSEKPGNSRAAGFVQIVVSVQTKS